MYIKACDYTCLTCLDVANGISDFECGTCSSANFRSTLSSRRCSCDAKYYDNGVALCASCHYSCATCNAFGDT